MTSARDLSRMLQCSDPGLRAWAKKEQERREGAKRRARGLRKMKRAQIPGKTAADRQAEYEARMVHLAEIRIGLHRESGGTCAVCGLPLPFALMHAHHILSGPERQVEERIETMAPAHDRCHDWLHGKDARRDQRDALVALLGYCTLTRKDPLAIASTEKRIRHIDEARAATGRTAP